MTRSPLACSALLALAAGPAAAITLEDYVDPNSAYALASAGGRLNVRSGASNRHAGGEDTDRVYQRSYDLALNANYRRVYSTLPLVWSTSASLNGTVERPDSYPVGGNGGSTDSLEAELGGSYDRYWERSPTLFWYSRGTLSYRSAAAQPQALLQAGVGRGRVFNATPLARALRVIDELAAFGLLTNYPGDVVMIELAQIVNREDEYRAQYGEDDYRQPWYGAIEAVLLGAGLLSERRLGAVGVIKLDDVLAKEQVATREHGWRAAAGLSVTVQDFDGDRGELGVSLAYRYAKPFGYKGQLIENVEWLAPLGGAGSNSLRNTLSYSHEIADLVDWINSWQLSVEGRDSGDRSVAHEWRSSFVYELSHSLDFDLSLRLNDSDDDAVDGVRSQLTTGISYRLR